MGQINVDSERSNKITFAFIQELFKLFSMESLILAQDERWRRA